MLLIFWNVAKMLTVQVGELLLFDARSRTAHQFFAGLIRQIHI